MAADPPQWAAVYYEPQTGKFAWARPFDTQAEAKRAAYNHAISQGFNMERYRNRWWTVRGGCIYVFKQVHGVHWGWGRHSDKTVARRQAQRRCETRGRDCRERVSVCSARGF